MLSRIRQHGWLPVAYVGVTLLFLLSCIWNFAHTYILAGGGNPLAILEGGHVELSGTALAMGLASVGSDIVKAMGGFILVAAITNKSFSWGMRGAVFALALVLITPTLLWSARSATGMAAMTFGDTIAGRNTDKVISRSVVSGIESAEERLRWLDGQKTCKGSECARHAKEATKLRAELKASRAELKTTKSIGAADPGSAIIAQATGAGENVVSTWTVILLILMVEITSTLGYPAIMLATRMQVRKDEETPLYLGKAEEAHVLQQDARLHDAAPVVTYADKQAGDGVNPPALYDAPNETSPEPAPAAEGDIGDRDKQAIVVATETPQEPVTSIKDYLINPNRRDRLVPFKRERDDRVHARISDGHVEAFVQTLSEQIQVGHSVPFRATVWDMYRRFCDDRNMRHMNDKALSNALAQFGITRHRPTGGAVYVKLPEKLHNRQFFDSVEQKMATAH